MDLRERAVDMLEALWSRGDDGPVRACVSPDFTYALSSESEGLDLDGYVELIGGFRSAFDPIDLILYRTLVEGARVMVHYSLTGEHVAPIFGIEATDRPLWVPAMTFMYFDGEQLERQVSLTDFLHVQRQLRAG